MVTYPGGGGGGTQYTSSFVPYTQVDESTFTWYNQKQATETTFEGIPTLHNSNTTGVQQFQIRATPLPSAPYRVRALFQINPGDNTADCEVGMVLADTVSTGCFSIGFGNNNGSANIFRSQRRTSWSNGSGGNYFDNSTTNVSIPIAVWFQYRDDGTNMYMDASTDGVIFTNFYTGAHNDFITPNVAGYFVASGGNVLTIQISVRSFIIEPTASLN